MRGIPAQGPSQLLFLPVRPAPGSAVGGDRDQPWTLGCQAMTALSSCSFIHQESWLHLLLSVSTAAILIQAACVLPPAEGDTSLVTPVPAGVGWRLSCNAPSRKPKAVEIGGQNEPCFLLLKSGPWSKRPFVTSLEPRVGSWPAVLVGSPSSPESSCLPPPLHTWFHPS